MFWIFICLGTGIIGLLLWCLSSSLKSDWLDIISIILMMCAAAGAVVILLFFGTFRVDIDYAIEEKYKDYKAYSTLYESDAYKNDPKAEMLLYQDILNYNEEMEKIHRKMNSNWCNIFYPKKVVTF